MQTAIEFRRAVADDMPRIGSIVVKAWQSTFAGLLSTDFLRGLSDAHQAERHARSFERVGVTYHVASDWNGDVVGFASGGPTRYRDFPSGNELYAIYILEAYHHRKIGSELFRRVVADLYGSGRKGLLVLALSSNPNRPFYVRLGARQEPAEPLVLGSETVDQVAYIWDDILAPLVAADLCLGARS